MTSGERLKIIIIKATDLALHNPNNKWVLFSSLNSDVKNTEEIGFLKI